MTVASLLGAAEARSQNFFNLALCRGCPYAVCQATVGQGEDGLAQPFALVTPTLVGGPTDEVRGQVVMVMPYDLSLRRAARAPMMASWSTTTSRFPWSASRREHAGAPRRCAWPCRGPSGPPRLVAQCSRIPTPGTDEDVDVLDIHLSRRLSLHG